MKKLFILAAAIVAFASCSKNEPEATVVPTREIQFATAAQTRANMTEVDVDYLKVNGFAVYGYAGTEAIFANTQVTYADKNALATSATWAPEKMNEVKYWASGVTYKFSAYAPMDKATFSFTSEGVRSITSYTNDGVTDLVVADKGNDFTLETTTTGDVTTATPVSMNFSHMLSRIKFTFVNSFTDTDVKINISDIKINEVGKVASASISEGNTPTWKITERYALAYDAPAQLTTPNQAVETYYQTMIPEGEKEYTLSFTVIVVADGKQIACTKYGGDAADADYKEAVKLPKTVFENGKGYDFKAHIKPTTVGDIYPIEFNVTVTKWVDPTEETVIPGFDA